MDVLEQGVRGENGSQDAKILYRCLCSEAGLQPFLVIMAVNLFSVLVL